MISMFDSGLILWEEIRCQSFLGAKGLRDGRISRLDKSGLNVYIYIYISYETFWCVVSQCMFTSCTVFYKQQTLLISHKAGKAKRIE